MKNLLKIWKWLKGKKTYLMSACLFLTYGSEGMGWLDQDTANVLKGLFMGGGLASLRAAKR